MLHACLVPCKDKYQRERRLVMLNALGKFSLVDSYVLILFVVAFRFHLELTESLGIDSFVIPVYGFYAFLAATCLSLVLGHALLFFHRKIATQDTHNDDTLHGKERILVHSFHCRDGDQPKQLNFFARALIIGLMLGTLSLLLAGFVQESFIFEFGGLAGAALGNDNSVISYSVLTLGVAIPQSFKDQKSLGAAILQLSYFAFTVFTPVTCLLVMLMLLVLPLSLKYQRKMLLICEAFNAWSAIEIFLLSIVAAVFQISRFAAFLIGDNCDSLNRIAEAIFDGATSDTVCFTVEASVNWNCWYLVVGTILDSWLMSFLLRMAHAAVEERTSNLSSEEDAATESAFRQPANHGWAVIQSLDAISVLGKWLFVPTMENLNAGVVRDENGPRFSETR
jgi:Paraquat-inducible protein A